MAEQDPLANPIQAVALKLPEFWTDNPALWFHSIEAQFHIRNIVADETKFYYVVAALPSSVANAVASTLRAPPDQNKYTALKKALTDFYEPPPLKRLLAFLQQGPTPDRRPRETLKQISALSDNLAEWRMAAFVQAMPPTVQAHLLARTFNDVTEMASVAEALVSQGLPDTIHVVRSKPSRPPTSSSSSDGICYYHRRFGDKAKQCRPPCRLAKQVVSAEPPENWLAFH